MDIGDLLYYAVILIGILASVIGKKKKKKEQKRYQTQKPEATREPVNQPKSEVQTILDQILKGNTSDSTPPPPEPKPAPVAKPDYYVSAEAHHQKAEDRKQEMRDNTRKATKKGKSDRNDNAFDIETPSQEADFQFDLRQAVLYSEVLRRPEY